MKFFVLIFLLVTNSFAVDLIQENQDIVCENSKVKVFIEKRDQHIIVQSGKNTQQFNAVEFLDTGILLKSTVNNEFALIQMTPRKTAVLIQGPIFKFAEASCQDSGSAKKCDMGKATITWSPEKFIVREGKQETSLDIYHYGVHPNDGTYFIAYNKSGAGLGLLDSGSQINLVFGKAKKLSCSFSK